MSEQTQFHAGDRVRLRDPANMARIITGIIWDGKVDFEERFGEPRYWMKVRIEEDGRFEILNATYLTLATEANDPLATTRVYARLA